MARRERETARSDTTQGTWERTSQGRILTEDEMARRVLRRRGRNISKTGSGLQYNPKTSSMTDWELPTQETEMWASEP
eukprot:9924232-Heterocapsa_arctica.AAC.1